MSKLLADWVPKASQNNQLNQRDDLSLAILTKIETNEHIFSLSAASLETKPGSSLLLFNCLVAGTSKSTALLYNFLFGKTTISCAIKFQIFTSLLIVVISADENYTKKLEFS